ncbi:glycosyltransferase [Candidatus Woesearchaeota archaeon]|nr:glycosyltransferase [Candidatus Woesearchaeota archaeon]
MNKERITIITPTYKRLSSLKESVNCVLNQTYDNWEHLIIADGHDPKVEEFIKGLNDDRIRYLSTESTNFVGNFQRNVGLKNAKGKFILFFDDDNLIYENYLKEMIMKFDADDIGYVICNIKYDNRIILAPKLPFIKCKVDTLNYMIRKDLIDKVGGWPGKKFQPGKENHDTSDFYLISSISKISKGNFLNKTLGEYRRLEKDIGKRPTLK